jgi:5-methyltetrahydrofolate--homocysteine methyltransferase
MNLHEFSDLLSDKKVIISDGATGTNLIQRGLGQGETGEKWVLEKPEMIKKLHLDFIEAGAEIILTSTFGASEVRLEQSGLKDMYEQVNHAAVTLAKEATNNTEVLVAGSIGPLGQMLKPFGPLEIKEAERYYARQAVVLCTSGVDIIIIETQYDLNEAKAAINGVKSSCDQALVCSFSFDKGVKTMMGVSPSSFAKEMESLGISAIGINCGKSLDDNFNALNELSNATDLPVWFKPNAGLPHLDKSGKPKYDITPEQMAKNIPSWIDAGARIIGGCCGTSPKHLKAITSIVNTLR